MQPIDASFLNENDKPYEQVCTVRDPDYDRILAGTEIVKEFIKERKLLIYGGTAIDFALKLRGSKIYPKTSIPDLDFYSPNFVRDAYDLVDILYKAGYEDARAKNAVHLGTVRVSVHDTFIADISYIPDTVYTSLMKLGEGAGYLYYTLNMKLALVSPLYQFIDLHISTAYLFYNPPMETVFHRVKKDITRLNHLYKYYSPERYIGKGWAQLNDIKKSDTGPKKGYIILGEAAYVLLYTKLNIAGKHNGKIAEPSGWMTIDGKFQYLVDTPHAKFGETDPAIGNMKLPRKITDDSITQNLYGNMIPLAQAPSDNEYGLPTVPFLMANLLGDYFLTNDKRYLILYTSIRYMCEEYADHPLLQLYNEDTGIFGSKNISMIQRRKYTLMAKNVGRDKFDKEDLLNAEGLPQGYSAQISKKHNLDRPEPIFAPFG